MERQSQGSGLLRDTVWNALSNGTAAGLGALVPILAARLSGAYWCGVVALATAMSQQLFNVGSFSTGAYQASDIGERRSFDDYVAAKALSVAVMVAAAVLWMALDWPGWDKAAAFASMMVFQASDAFSGAFFSRYQQKGRLDIACRIRCAKLAAFGAVFAGVICATRRPLPALAFASAVHVLLFFVLDIPRLRVFGPLRIRFPGRASVSILAACAPLAASAFFTIYIHNGPRFAVDALLDEVAFAEFSALFLISFAVAACAEFIMNPHVVPLAEAVRSGDRRAGLRTVLMPMGAVSALGVVAVAAAAPVGIPVLSFLFGLDLSPYGLVLAVILVGGSLVALYALAQMVLTVLRKQAWGVPGLVLAVVSTLAATRPLTSRLGLAGAALSYCAASAFLALPAIAAAAVFLLRRLPRVRPGGPDGPGNASGGGTAAPDGPPLVSVLIPVHNAGNHIRRCLDSLAKQTFRDFEAVALDDGSTDSSLAELRSFATMHPFLRVESQPNAGTPAARNRLVRLARGEFVMFLDNDDAYDADCIARFVHEARRTGADIVCGAYRRVSPDGRPLLTVRMTDPLWSPLVVVEIWCKLYRRAFLTENGIEFPDYGIGEDIFFSFRAYSAARSIACMDYAGYNWTFNETSVSNTAHRAFRPDRPDLDPVRMLDGLFSLTGTSGLYPRFYVRHVVWHLLYAGRGSSPDEFLRQEKRLFAWLDSRGIPPRQPFSWHFVKARDFRAFLAVRAFLVLRRFGLLPLFARFYCRA